MNLANEERALDLMVGHATEGLDGEAEVELQALLEQPLLSASLQAEKEAIELAAASIELAFTFPDEPLPAPLRTKLSSQATAHFGSKRIDEGRQKSVSGENPAVDYSVRKSAREGSSDRARWLGWIVAAAAAAIAVLIYYQPSPRIEPPLPAVESPTPMVVRDTPESPAQARDRLIRQADDLVQIAWTASDDSDPTPPTGDVVWSSREQTGFMHFVGLPANDPELEQYQLWIFDTAQDERFPIDGGVFNISAEGDFVVPIKPKLGVVKPTLFAITIEKPGGVVVSNRERLPLLAKVG